MTVTHWVLAIRIVNRTLGFGMSFLAVRLASEGTPVSTIGLFIALFGAMTIPSRLLGGVLADRFGNRTAAALGLGAAGMAQLAVSVAHDPRLLFAAILLLGLAYEIVEPATQAAVADDAQTDELARQFALLWAAVSVAGILAGLLAALLLPVGVWALFLVDGLGSLLAAGLAWAVLPAQRRADNADPQVNWRHVWTRPLVTWTAVATLYATQIMVVVFMLPLAVSADGLPAWLAGVVLAVSAAGAMASQPVLRILRSNARRTDTWILVAGHLSLALAVGLWATGTVCGYLAGAVVEGVAGAALIGTYQATAARLAPPGHTASTLATFGLCWGAAAVIAPALAGPMLLLGTRPLWLAVGAASLLSTAVVMANPVSAVRNGRS